MARTIEELPRPIREIENVFVPMRDGVELAARLWLPADAEARPVPAILEAIPYRKRDFMRLRDEPIHRYYAGHGYGAVRLDLRGSGDSGGILTDEYSSQEHEDLVEVIEWLAKQPWCDGNVGMTGISWGGFNALQVAACAPPALKAIITLCASDDRYADDAHFAGGCLLNENQIWGTVLFALNALPPDPAIVGDSWRDTWMRRLEADRPFPAHWLRHSRRDDYWKHGSVCEDFSRIRCPVYAIGGWADGYSNAIPRLLEHLQVPRKGLIGPWAHTFPHNGVPGPAIGYLQEALRWWDQWLKGRETGITEEPMLRAWMQDRVDPEPFHPVRPGRWVAEDSWPPGRASLRLHATGGGVLGDRVDESASLTMSSPQSTGLSGGDWCGFGGEGEAPFDQRIDDGRSLVFDTEPLDEPLQILGDAVATLRVTVDQPVAMVAVRLNDVAPDGSSARVTYAVLNLTHRDSHEEPTPLEPGEPVTVTVRLNTAAHRFAAGHRIRLAVSTSYWPIAWPAPETVNLALETSGTWLDLPVRAPRAADDSLPEFASPEVADPTSSQTPLTPSKFDRSIERDLTTNEILYRMMSEGGDLEAGATARIEDIDLDLGHSAERCFWVGENDPGTARTQITEKLMMRRGDWCVQIRARTRLECVGKSFRARAELEACEGGEVVFERSWDEMIPRDLL